MGDWRRIDTDTPKTASRKKTTNVSYRSSRPASTKRADSDRRTSSLDSRTSARSSSATGRSGSAGTSSSRRSNTAANSGNRSRTGASYTSDLDAYRRRKDYSMPSWAKSEQAGAESTSRTSENRFSGKQNSERDTRKTQSQSVRKGSAASSVKSRTQTAEKEKLRHKTQTSEKKPAQNPSGSGNHNGNGKGPKNPKKTRKPIGCLPLILITLAMIVFLTLALFLGVRGILHTAFNKIDKYTLDTDQLVTTSNDKNMNGYTNIALFGVDDQDNQIHDKGSRTDCIMIASINNRTKKVKLMSIYRDTYSSIDGKYDKINAAYSYGGPELALSTINRNLDLNVTDFATVNFRALADTVDILGGVELTVRSAKELKNLNDYIHNMNNINGGDSPKFDEPDEYPFTAVFDGNQAVAYSRIRYFEGGDYERANHQRIVVKAIVNGVKKSPWKIKDIINNVLPQCKTSLSTKEMTSMSFNLLRYEFEDSQAYPFSSGDGKYYSAKEGKPIWYEFPTTVYSNTVEAHKYLFGTTNYVPTQELCLISEKIKSITDTVDFDE